MKHPSANLVRCINVNEQLTHVQGYGMPISGFLLHHPRTSHATFGHLQWLQLLSA